MNTWLEQQDGTVYSFEKVAHTFINEETGEMFCAKCCQSEHTRPNRSDNFMRFIDQGKAFERFTEKHLHDAVEAEAGSQP